MWFAHGLLHPKKDKTHGSIGDALELNMNVLHAVTQSACFTHKSNEMKRSKARWAVAVATPSKVSASLVDVTSKEASSQCHSKSGLNF